MPLILFIHEFQQYFSPHLTVGHLNNILKTYFIKIYKLKITLIDLEISGNR